MRETHKDVETEGVRVMKGFRGGAAFHMQNPLVDGR